MSCWRDGEHIRAGGRDLRVVARPGHSTTDALFVDDRERSRSSATTCSPRSPPTPRSTPRWSPRVAPPRARRVPGEPAADGGDAARPPAHRARRRHHRLTSRSSRAAWPTTSAAANGSSSALGAGDTTAYGIAADLWPEKNRPRATPAGRLGGARTPRPAAGRRTRPRAGHRRRQHVRRRVLRARRHPTHAH